MGKRRKKKIIGLQEELEKETAAVEEKTKVLKELEVKCKKLGRQVFSSSNHYDVKAARCEDLEKQLIEVRRANEEMREKLREAVATDQEEPELSPLNSDGQTTKSRSKRRKRKKDTTTTNNTERKPPVKEKDVSEPEEKTKPENE